MDRVITRLGGATSPERLRTLLRLDLLCEAQRTRRRVAVHLLAASGLPLLAALRWPGVQRQYGAFFAESWLALAVATLGLWAAELHYARQLDRTLRQR